LLERLFGRMAREAGLATVALPADLRLRRTGTLRFAFNYGPDAVALPAELGAGGLLLGEDVLPPAGVAVWRDAFR
jgi:beta-galactosidase